MTREIWGLNAMTRVLVGLACSLLLAHALTGCGEEARNEDLTPDEAASLLAEAGTAMKAVESYRAQVVISFSRPAAEFDQGSYGAAGRE